MNEIDLTPQVVVALTLNFALEYQQLIYMDF